MDSPAVITQNLVHRFQIALCHPHNRFIRDKVLIPYVKAPPFFPQELQRPVNLIPGCTPATSIHFPDFPLSVMPEKVKENDFPVFFCAGHGKSSFPPQKGCGWLVVATSPDIVVSILPE